MVPGEACQQDGLDVPDVGPVSQKVRDYAVPKGVRADSLYDPCSFDRFLHRGGDNGFLEIDPDEQGEERSQNY